MNYPIGRHERPREITPEMREQWIQQIADAPSQLRAAVDGLTAEQLDTPYRPEGWTVRQVVHHLADSHVNLYVRLRLALTEDHPLIKLYDEKGWAELEDARTAPVELSLNLLDALHARWVMLLRSLPPDQFRRTFSHPKNGQTTVDESIAMYAWHGRHHIAHVTSLLERMGWKRV
jgi:uncharacterized damage-inducible protein DinB